MAEHDPKQDKKLNPEDEQGLKREAGDRPVPTPGHIGNAPDMPAKPDLTTPRH
jgi:hypothetical protein